MHDTQTKPKWRTLPELYEQATIGKWKVASVAGNTRIEVTNGISISGLGNTGVANKDQATIELINRSHKCCLAMYGALQLLVAHGAPPGDRMRALIVYSAREALRLADGLPAQEEGE